MLLVDTMWNSAIIVYVRNDAIDSAFGELYKANMNLNLNLT